MINVNMTKAKEIDADLIFDTFEYVDGELLWKYDRGTRARKGNVAGGITGNGYKMVKLNGRGYLVSRLVYILHNGNIPENCIIDHVNGDTLDNRIENLRAITQTKNTWNTAKSKGCHQLPSGNWRAEITSNGIRKRLGVFKTELEAMFAYKEAKKHLHMIEV